MGFLPALAGLAGINLISGLIQNRANRENLETQKEFAQNGIRWRVADAVAAGLHPLAALGANTPSPSFAIGDDGVATAFRDTGQDISRAIHATRTPEERTMAELNVKNAQLELDGRFLENQIKASQLRKMNEVGPTMPSWGGEPVKTNRQFLDGTTPDVAYSFTKNGLVPVMPPIMSEALQNQTFGSLRWSMRNDMYHPVDKPPKEYLQLYGPEYNDWQWYPIQGTWKPVGRYGKPDKGADSRELLKKDFYKGGY